MIQPATPGRTCPKYDSSDYSFRSRKKIPPEEGQAGPEQIETKYRCKACGHEWKVKTPANGGV